MKSALVLLILLVLTLVIKFAFERGYEVEQTVTPAPEEFSPCLPVVYLSQEEFLATDEKKNLLVAKSLKKAKNIQKTLSQDPAELWKALEYVVFVEEVMKNCKNPKGSLQIQAIDLKSSLLATQKQWVQKLQMEVLRNQRKNNQEGARYCLNKLLRLVPDEKHAFHQRWLKELLP